MDMSLTVDGCEAVHAKDVVKALLHVILFHRLFGQIVPRTHELLDLTIPSVDDSAVESLIDERAAAYVKTLRVSGSPPALTGAQTPSIVVEFYEKKMRKLWFSRAEEEVCWESWSIHVNTISPPRTESERKQNSKALRVQLEAAIMKILRLVNARNDEYIPPIPYSEGNPFPYQILLR